MVSAVAITLALPFIFASVRNDIVSSRDLALWQVQFALAAVALPILIFVIQLAHEDRTSAQRQVEVLVRYTYVFPITVFVVASIITLGIGLLWYPSSLGSLVGFAVFCVSLVVTTFAFLRLLDLIYHRDKLRHRGESLIIERFRESLDRTTDERIGASIMVSWMEEQGAAYSYLSPSKERYIPVGTSEVGYIVDVHLERLQQVLSALPKKGEGPETTGATPYPGDLQTPRIDQRPPIVFARLVGDQTYEADRTLIHLDRDVFDLEAVVEISARLETAYKFEPLTLTTHRDSLRPYLDELRGSVLFQIRDRDATGVARGIRTYLRLVDAFHAHLKKLGIAYGRDQARREASSIIRRGSWQAIEWLRDDYIDLLEEAFAHPQTDILREILYFPYAVAQRALLVGDFLTVQQVVRSGSSYPYVLSQRMSDDHTRSLVIDRLHSFPAEFLRFTVRAALDRTDVSEELEFATDVASEIVLLFGARLKAAWDLKDLESFKLFASKLREAVRDLRGVRERPEREEPHEGDADPAKRLEQLEALVRFGLYSWISSAYERNDMTPDAGRAWLAACGSFGSISNLLQIYAKALQLETQDLLGWDLWVIEGTEGQVVSIDFTPKIHGAMILLLWRYAATVYPNYTLPTDLNLARSLGNASRPDGPLRNMLTQVEANPQRFADLIGEDPTVRSDGYADLVTSIHERWKASWRDAVLMATLDPERVAQFGYDIHEAFAKGAGIREVLASRERVRVVQETPRDVVHEEWVGFNHLLPKESFVPEAVVIMEPYAAGIGRDLASANSERVARCLFDQVAGEQRVATPGGLAAIIEGVDQLRRAGYEPSILLIGAWKEYREIALDPRLEWEGARRRAISGYMGRFDGADAYEIHARNVHGILIADIARFAEWVDFRPHAESLARGLELLGDRLMFGLTEVDQALARSWVDERPDEMLREKETGGRESHDEAVERLCQTVQFRLFSRVACIVEDPQAALLIPSASDDPED